MDAGGGKKKVSMEFLNVPFETFEYCNPLNHCYLKLNIPFPVMQARGQAGAIGVNAPFVGLIAPSGASLGTLQYSTKVFGA